MQGETVSLTPEQEVDRRAARINDLGGYQHLFDAIAAAVKIWPSKERATGISVSVFDFVEALDRAALQETPDAG
jgi:hypothetical protein